MVTIVKKKKVNEIKVIVSFRYGNREKENQFGNQKGRGNVSGV